MLGRYLAEKSGKAVEVVDCCYDIPLHDSLQALFKDGCCSGPGEQYSCYVAIMCD